MTKPEQGMRISAVSKITGIPTDTLRAWERRYELVSPSRSGKTSRIYSREDVQKLSLVKMLVDRGHAISNVARHSIVELQELLSLHGKDESNNPVLSRPLRVLICGEALALSMQHEQLEESRINLLGIHSTVASAESIIESGEIDALVLEYASLHDDDLQEITQIYRRSNAGSCYILYGYANSALLDKFRKQGFVMSRAPMKPSALAQLLLACAPVELDDVLDDSETIELNSLPAKSRFSTANLVRLSSIDSAIKCECPQHLAELILNLSCFENYSEDCENRSEEDAELHRSLKNACGHSRNILERALQRVIEAEGLTLE